METMVEPRGEDQAAMHAPPIRVLFVSDVQLVRQAIANVLAGDPSISVVRCGDPVEMAVLDLTAHVDAVLIHTALEAALSLAKRLRVASPHLPIIAYPLRETTEEVVAWAAAGATGYIPVNVSLDQFVTVLKGILRGEQVCSARVAASLLRRITATSAAVVAELRPTRPLTVREWQVADLIASQLRDKEIAENLSIGLATAKSHVHNVLRKLGVRRRRDIADALHGLRVARFDEFWRSPRLLGSGLMRQ